MKELEFEVFGRRIAALGSGAEGGPRVLALHGWLDNAASYIPLAAALPECQWVVPVLAGNGRSDHRSMDGEYNIWNDLPDIEALVNALGWDEFVLIGHSRGAVIAGLFAATLPQRVSRLVLLDGLPSLATEAGDSLAQLRNYLQDKRTLQDKPGRVFSRIEDAVAVRERIGMTTASARLIAERNLTPCEGGWRWTHDPRLQGASAFRLTAAHNDAVLLGIDMPALLLLATGGQRQRRETLPELPPSMTVVSVEGGHHCHMEDSVAVIAGHLRDFLDQA